MKYARSFRLLILAALLPVAISAGPHLQTSQIDPCTSGYARWNGTRFVCIPLAQAPAPSIDALSPLTATVGATVTITGRFLSAIASVVIGTTNVPSFARVNDTTVTFVVPAGATTGTVTVTDTAAQTATSLDSLIVQTGTITGITVTDATLPFGTSVQLTGSCTGTGTFDTNITWTLAPDPDGCDFLGANVTPQGLFTSPTAAQTCYPGNTVCNSAGTCRAIAACVAEPSRTATATIVMAAAPATSFAITPSTSTRTVNSTLTLTASGGILTNGTPSYTWAITTYGSGAPTLSATTGTSVVYTAGVSAGTDIITVTDTNADPDVSTSVTINVTATPTVLAAFPGAEGGGAGSLGGRRGTVYRVTNLNDAGAGSLRACVEASGPRTCVFTTGGTITLSTPLEVNNPYLTIAGQTAQGGGIALSGKNLTSNVMTIYGTAHDVVIRYLRVWKGYNAGTNVSAAGSNIHLEGPNNVILDHYSGLWTQSKGVSVWRGSASEPRSITVQWSLLAEPLAAHPTSMITGSETRSGADQTTDIDWHHNYLASGSHRNPLLKNKSTRWVNNLVYNWNTWAGETGGGAAVDVIGNVWRRGPMSTFTGREWLVFPAGNATTPNGDPSIYFVNNITATQGNALAATDLASWATATGQVTDEGINTYVDAAVDTIYRRTSPMPIGTTHPITTTTLTGSGSNLTDVLLGAGGAGASQRLDCAGNWVSNRDAADTRITGYFPSGGPSTRPTDEDVMGGFPTLAVGTACADADTDGIPDTYETASCGTTTCLTHNTVQPSGYTSLEYYLAGLAIPPSIGGNAFPGCEGGGCGSGGGRGGMIYRVTNLNDAGAGSLRACVEASGPRTCVFTTGGTITLASRLTVLNPYLTIAGQTAQGEGITLDGRNLTVSVMSIRTHNVIVRYIRVRKGYNTGTASQEGSALGLDATAWNNDVNNIVIDHVSASWGQDETLGAWTGTGASATRAVKNVTFSNNMAYEGLVPHQTIGPIGANEKAAADAMTDIDYIGNILANGGNRFPLFKGKSGTFANNIVYNWTWWATFAEDGATLDILNNIYKRGPLTATTGSDSYAVIVGNPGCASCGATGSPSVYVAGNSYQGSVPGDQWAVSSRIATQVNGEGGHYCINDAGTTTEPTCYSVRSAWRRASPRTRTAGVEVTLKTVSQAETDALAAGGAGNSKRLNCDGTWTNFRDAVDTRIITQYNDGTGGSPTHEYDAGYTGFPSLAAGTACPDTDSDGIPDTYETASCGTTTCLAHNVVQPSGYTNLEYYLAGLAIPAGGGGGGGSGTVELNAGPVTGTSAIAGLTVSTPITTTAANVMIVAVVNSEHGTQSHGALTVSSSGGLSCTSRAAATYLNYVRSEIWTCWAASPGTYTVTGTFASGPDTLRRYLAVYAFAGASQTLGANQTKSTGGGANEAQTIQITPTATGSFLVMGGSSGGSGAAVTWLPSTVGGLHWAGPQTGSSLITGRHGPTTSTAQLTLGTSAPSITGVTSALEIVPAP